MRDCAAWCVLCSATMLTGGAVLFVVWHRPKAAMEDT